MISFVDQDSINGIKCSKIAAIQPKMAIVLDDRQHPLMQQSHVARVNELVRSHRQLTIRKMSLKSASFHSNRDWRT